MSDRDNIETVRALHNGRALGSEWVMIFTLRNGKVTNVAEYFDPTTINAAFA